MQLYFEVVVSYDIEDNKNRKSLYEDLKDLSLVPIQKSVFCGCLKQAELKILPHLFRRYCAAKDRAFYVRARLDELAKNGFGYDVESFKQTDFEYF